MTIIYILLGIIAGIVVLVLLIALFLKTDYNINRTIIINKPVSAVFDYLKYLKNQDNYSKWATMDPNMIKTHEGIDGAVGFRSAWDSKDKNVGKGEQEIIAITENKRVDYKIHFIKPFDGLADSALTTASIGNNMTNVAWGLKSKLKYPMNIMLLFMNMEKMIGTDLEIGLNNLKTILEK